ncbi:hypothetical protein BC629DRAFT_154706 [Irpex lacteus]|nr:hypothetical protein BC629DRAFT_154706 [Irpex lacteus]
MAHQLVLSELFLRRRCVVTAYVFTHLQGRFLRLGRREVLVSCGDLDGSGGESFPNYTQSAAGDELRKVRIHCSPSLLDRLRSPDTFAKHASKQWPERYHTHVTATGFDGKGTFAESPWSLIWASSTLPLLARASPPSPPSCRFLPLLGPHSSRSFDEVSRLSSNTSNNPALAVSSRFLSLKLTMSGISPLAARYCCRTFTRWRVALTIVQWAATMQ